MSVKTQHFFTLLLSHWDVTSWSRRFCHRQQEKQCFTETARIHMDGDCKNTGSTTIGDVKIGWIYLGPLYLPGLSSHWWIHSVAQGWWGYCGRRNRKTDINGAWWRPKGTHTNPYTPLHKQSNEELMWWFLSLKEKKRALDTAESIHDIIYIE